MARGPARTLITVTGDLYDRLADFHRVAGIPGNVADTARELLRSALDSPAMASALVTETRRRAYRQVRNDMIKRWQQAAFLIKQEFERSLTTFNDSELDIHFDQLGERETGT